MDKCRCTFNQGYRRIWSTVCALGSQCCGQDQTKTKNTNNISLDEITTSLSRKSKLAKYFVKNKSLLCDNWLCSLISVLPVHRCIISTFLRSSSNRHITLVVFEPTTFAILEQCRPHLLNSFIKLSTPMCVSTVNSILSRALWKQNHRHLTRV